MATLLSFIIHSYLISGYIAFAPLPQQQSTDDLSTQRVLILGLVFVCLLGLNAIAISMSIALKRRFDMMNPDEKPVKSGKRKAGNMSGKRKAENREHERKAESGEPGT